MYVEEAIATQFSLELIGRIFGQSGVEKCEVSPDYRYSKQLAYEIDEDIIRLGKRLREHAGALENVTVGTIAEIYPDASRKAILDSVTRFQKRKS